MWANGWYEHETSDGNDGPNSLNWIKICKQLNGSAGYEKCSYSIGFDE